MGLQIMGLSLALQVLQEEDQIDPLQVVSAVLTAPKLLITRISAGGPVPTVQERGMYLKNVG